MGSYCKRGLAIAWAIASSSEPRLISPERKAIPHPVLTAFWSVGSVRLTKSSIPSLTHWGRWRRRTEH